MTVTDAPPEFLSGHTITFSLPPTKIASFDSFEIGFDLSRLLALPPEVPDETLRDIANGVLDGWGPGEPVEWIKGQGRSERGVCLGVRIRSVIECHPTYATESRSLTVAMDAAVRKVINEQYPDRVPDELQWRTISWFNDHPLTKWDDIHLVVTKVAVG